MPVRIHGLREADKALQQLPLELQKRVVTGALAASARVVRDDAKRRVPVASGKTRESIVVRRAKGAARARGVLVVLGFIIGRSRIVHLLEFGTSKMAAKPFIRPAIAATERRAVEAFGKVMAAGIARQAKKLAGPMTRRQRARTFR